MTFILQFFLEVTFYIIVEFLFTMPGAFVKWIYRNISGKQISFKECLSHGMTTNYAISIVILLSIVGLILLVKSLLS